VNLKLKTKNLQLGQSLFEVVLALGVITAITIGIVSLAASSIRNAGFSKNKTLAGRYVEEATEWLRSERDTNFSAFEANIITSIWCLSGLDWTKVGVCGESDNIPDTSLFRNVTFSSLPSGNTIIRANVRVYWTDGQGDHEVSSITSFTDWRQR